MVSSDDIFVQRGEGSDRSRWYGTRQAMYSRFGPSRGGKTVLLPLVVVLLEYSPMIGRIAGEKCFLGYKLLAWRWRGRRWW